MAIPERIDIGMAIHCKPSATTFSDLTEDCQRHFFRNVPLNQRMLIRSVCSEWKKLIDESFKNLKKLRIFDSRQSLVDYAHTLNRTSQQRDPELSFDPYDTLILTIPNSVLEEEKLHFEKECEKEISEQNKLKALKKQKKKDDEAAEDKIWQEKEEKLKIEIAAAKEHVGKIEKSIEYKVTRKNKAPEILKKAKANYNNALQKMRNLKRSRETLLAYRRMGKNGSSTTALAQQMLHLDDRFQNLANHANEVDRNNVVVNNGDDNAVAVERIVDEDQVAPPQNVPLRGIPPGIMPLQLQQGLYLYAEHIPQRGPDRERPRSNVKKRYTDLSDFIKPLFPDVTSLVIWTNYITCTPGQLDVAKLISAWQSTLQVLSVSIYASGKFEDYDGIDMEEFLLLRTNHLEAISKLPLLRRFYMGELESQPNVFIPERVRWLRPSFRYNFRCSLQLPTSVERLSLNFRVFDSASHWEITSLLKNATHVTELDVTYMRKNARFRELHCLLMDFFMELPNVVKLSVDVCTLETELNNIPRDVRSWDEPQKKFLSSSAIETIQHISLTDRFNFLHNNSCDVNYNSSNFRMQAEIFCALGAAFPKLQSLTMVSKYADDKDYQIFVRSLVFSNCPLRWADLLHFEKLKDCLPLERKVLQFRAAEKNVPVAGQFIPSSAALQSDSTQEAAPATDKKRRTTQDTGVTGTRPVNKRIRFTDGDEVLEEDETEVEVAADRLRLSLTQADELISFFSEEEFEDDDDDIVDDSDADDSCNGGKDGVKASQTVQQSLVHKEE